MPATNFQEMRWLRSFGRPSPDRPTASCPQFRGGPAMQDRAIREETSRDQTGSRALIPFQPAETGVHPISIEIALGAALWFITVTWVGFARGGEIDWDLVVMTLFFIGFFALFLLASYAVKDKRWRLPSTSFPPISRQSSRNRDRHDAWARCAHRDRDGAGVAGPCRDGDRHRRHGDALAWSYQAKTAPVSSLALWREGRRGQARNRHRSRPARAGVRPRRSPDPARERGDVGAAHGNSGACQRSGSVKAERQLASKSHFGVSPSKQQTRP